MGHISMEQFLGAVHTYTTRVSIKVVIGAEYTPAKDDGFIRKCLRVGTDYYLALNTAEDDDEGVQRLLAYYKDCPVWNLNIHVDVDRTGASYPAIVGMVHYSDIRQSWILEQHDIEVARSKEKKSKKHT